MTEDGIVMTDAGFNYFNTKGVRFSVKVNVINKRSTGLRKFSCLFCLMKTKLGGNTIPNGRLFKESQVEFILK